MNVFYNLELGLRQPFLTCRDHVGLIGGRKIKKSEPQKVIGTDSGENDRKFRRIQYYGWNPVGICIQIGADEACLMELLIRKNKKGKFPTSECRASIITMFRSGVSIGGNDLTGFFMKGKKRRAGYTDNLLVNHGCEEGSTIIMTENAFMTNDAWIELTKKV